MDVLDRAYAESLLTGVKTGNVVVEKAADGTLTFFAQKGTADECSVSYTPAELQGPQGISVKKAEFKDISNTTHLVFTLSDDSTIDAGVVPSGTIDYKEEITTASNIWSIQHNLNTEWYELFINIIDTDNNLVYGDIDVANSTNNLLVIKFNTPVAGKIIINK